MTTRLQEDATAPGGTVASTTHDHPGPATCTSSAATPAPTCPRVVRLRALRQVRYFVGLPDARLDAIDRRMTATSRVAGECLYRVGEPARHLYVLAAGEVRLSRHPWAEETAVTEVVEPGRVFGAMSALGEPVHTDTAHATRTSCSLAMDQATFRAVLREHPDVALLVLEDIADRLAGAQAGAEAARRATDTIAQRVAASLLRLADSMGQLRAGVGTLIPVPLSSGELADLAAAPPESVSRVMARLREDGIIDSSRRWTPCSTVAGSSPWRRTVRCPWSTCGTAQVPFRLVVAQPTPERLLAGPPGPW